MRACLTTATMRKRGGGAAGGGRDLRLPPSQRLEGRTLASSFNQVPFVTTETCVPSQSKEREAADSSIRVRPCQSARGLFAGRKSANTTQSSVQTPNIVAVNASDNIETRINASPLRFPT